MEGLGSFLLFALFFFFMMRFGCGSHGHGSHGKGGHEHSQEKINDEKHIDPVCGVTVEMDKGYGKMHEGDLYRFCTRRCLDKFEKEPEHYLNRKLNHDHGGES